MCDLELVPISSHLFIPSVWHGEKFEVETMRSLLISKEKYIIFPSENKILNSRARRWFWNGWSPDSHMHLLVGWVEPNLLWLQCIHLQNWNKKIYIFGFCSFTCEKSMIQNLIDISVLQYLITQYNFLCSSTQQAWRWTLKVKLTKTHIFREDIGVRRKVSVLC